MARSSLFPDFSSYVQGVQAAQYEPSVAASAVKGLTDAVDTNQRWESNRVNTEAQKARTQIAVAENARAEKLAPLQMQVAQAQAETALQQQKNLPLLQQIKQKELEVQAQKNNVDLLKTNLEVASVQRNLKLEENVLGTLDQINSGDPAKVKEGISALSQALPRVMQYSFKDKEPNMGVVGVIQSLPELAASTGDQATIQQADRIVQSFQKNLNIKNAKEGQNISLTEPNQQSSSAEVSPQQQLNSYFNGTPSSGSNEAPSAPAQQPATATNTSGPDVSSPSRPPALFTPVADAQAQPSPEQAADERGKAAVAQYVKQENDKRPFSQRLLEDAVASQLPWKQVDAIGKQVLERLRKVDPTIDSSSDVFKEQFKKAMEDQVQFSEKDVQSLDKVRNANFELEDMVGVARRTLNTYEALKKEDPSLPNLGTTGAVNRYLTQMLGKAGYTSPEKRSLVDNFMRDMNSLSNKNIFRMYASGEATGGMLNSDKEGERAVSIGFNENNSMERNKEILAYFEAKLSNGKAYTDIVDAASKLPGIGLTQARQLANQYLRLNPAIKVTDKNGVDFSVNVNRTDPMEWLDKQFNKNAPVGRDSTGRALKSSVHLPSTASEKVYNDITNASGKFTPTADAGDIPLFMPSVSPELISRVAFQESGGNPNAVGPETKYGRAKGAMQLLSSTGKELWKNLYPGQEYQPFDLKKNLEAGATYLNQLLESYRGNTMLALAAYNFGPGNLGKAIQKAKDMDGEITWAALKKHLPEETQKYVDNILAPDATRVNANFATDTEEQKAIASLPSAVAQNNASAMLTPQGMKELAVTANVKDPNELPSENVFRKAYEMLWAPFAANEAQAESPKEITPSAQPAQAQQPQLTTIQKINSMIPESLRAFSLGATKSLLFGADEEAFAGMQSLMSGEPYDQIVERNRAIVDQVKSENPKMFFTGEIGGAVSPYNALTGGLKIAQKGMSAVKGVQQAVDAASIVEKAADATEKAGIFKTALQSAPRVAGENALTGFNEGEGGFTHRLENAGVQGTLGTIIGTGTSVAGQGVAKGVGATIRKGMDLIDPSRVASREAKAVEQAAAKEGATILGGTPDSGFQQLKSNVAKDSQPFPLARNVSSSQREGFREAASKSTSGIQEMTKNTEEVLSKTPGRIKQVLDSAQKLPSLENITEPFRSFANVVKRKQEELQGKLISTGEKAYGAVADALPRAKRNIKGAPEVPVVNSREVLSFLRTNPAARAALKEVRSDTARGLDKHPANSFEVVQAVWQKLRDADGGKTLGTGAANRKAGRQFKEILDREFPEFDEANKLYKIAADARDKTQTRALEGFAKLSDPAEVKDITQVGKQLFSLDQDTLKATVDQFATDADSRTLMQRAALTHIWKDVVSKGERRAGEAVDVPNLTRDLIPQKLDVLFGKGEGQRLVKQMEALRGVADIAHENLRLSPRSARRLDDLIEYSADNQMTKGMEAFGTATAISGGASPQSAAWVGNKFINYFKTMRNTSNLQTDRKIAEHISKAFSGDNKEAVKFLDSIESLAGEGLQDTSFARVRRYVDKGTGALMRVGSQNNNLINQRGTQGQ